MKLKNFIVIALLVCLAGCDSVEVVKGVNGSGGATGATGAAGQDGHDGHDGANGQNGTNGHSLVAQVVTLDGGDELECPGVGGNRLDIYLDLNDDLTLDEGDLYENSLLSCNGQTGIQGVAGEQGPQGVGIPGPQGDAGPNGTNGSSCSVISVSGGAQISCTNGTSAFVSNGTNGTNGSNGTNGTNGTGATIVSYDISGGGCVSVGSGYYAKKSGSSDAKLYNSSSCNGSALVDFGSNGDSFWLTSSKLAFLDANSGLNIRVISYQ